MSSSSQAPRLQIDHLTVRFPSREERAISDLSGSIDPGATIAITGPSGCGKTTLLRTLAGFIPSMIEAEVSGSVRIDGQVWTPSDRASRSPKIGLVQQDPDAQICTLRVQSEVAFGPQNLCLPYADVTSRVSDALGKLGIEHLAARDTTTLSGGEKQRLAVASILAMQPEIVLLDEPTAHLDPQASWELFELLGQLQASSGCTLVIVEHRLAPLAALDPQLWVLDRGTLVERDPLRDREDILELARGIAPLSFGDSAEGPGEAIRIRNLGFGYRTRLFEGLTFDLEPGEILGIIGPNGAGKTTLLRLLAGLDAPDEGEIKLPGGMAAAMVFQHPHQQIFERTVRRDLEIDGALDASQLQQFLSRARLGGLEDAPPHALSLGEQRRLTVLTALRRGQTLLLLDEPFIGQDRENVAWIVSQIEAARREGAIVCLVTHDVSTAAALCDRILFLGSRIQYGDPGDVFRALEKQGEIAFSPRFWDGAP